MVERAQCPPACPAHSTPTFARSAALGRRRCPCLDCAGPATARLGRGQGAAAARSAAAAAASAPISRHRKCYSPGQEVSRAVGPAGANMHTWGTGRRCAAPHCLAQGRTTCYCHRFSTTGLAIRASLPSFPSSSPRCACVDGALRDRGGAPLCCANLIFTPIRPCNRHQQRC